MMKKFLIFLAIFILPFTNVCAEEKIQEEKKYRYYYIEKEYSNKFYEKEEKVADYPHEASTYVYDTNLNESYEKPEYEEDIVNEIPVIKYQEFEKVRYITIDKFKSGQSINLQEIEVFSNGEKVNYLIECKTCTSEFFAKIQNTLRGYEKNYISGSEKMVLDLQKEYFPDDLEVVLHFGGNYGYTASYDVVVNNTRDPEDKYYYYHTDMPLNFYVESRQRLKNVKHDERLDNEVKEIEGVDSVRNAKILEKNTKYQYRTRLYQHYRENKIYVDGYYKNLPGLIRDDENFVISKIEEETPKTITEYIEKEVLVPIVNKEKIPVIEEKIKYLTKTVDKKVEVPKEVIKEVEVVKKVNSKEKNNYILSYSVYFLFGIILKKMSKFKV